MTRQKNNKINKRLIYKMKRLINDIGVLSNQLTRSRLLLRHFNTYSITNHLITKDKLIDKITQIRTTLNFKLTKCITIQELIISQLEQKRQ